MSSELFRNIPSTVGQLVGDVRSGRIGLPDLQRPFVWPDSKIRDLFDSMMKGYPIGFIMLWEAPESYDDKKSSIGLGQKTYDDAKELVIDGQQRLTGLLAAMYGIKIKDKNYKEKEIKISYNPLTKEFKVWTNATERSAEWISKVSDVFLAKEANKISSLRKDYVSSVNGAREKKGQACLSDEEETIIEDNINELLDLVKYPLPQFEILNTADEEAVSDIFVRVNSGGQKLNEGNFIQTLLSVYEKDLFDQMDAYCAASRIPASGTSYNNILQLETTHLIRMAVGLGFKRARLKYAYKLMRGKDLETEVYSVAERDKNLAIFKDAMSKVMNLNTWHGFLEAIGEAGYQADRLVAANNAVVFSYVLYLIGKYDYNLPDIKLKRIIAKWFFMATITRFYTGNFESDAETQFLDLKSVRTGEQFCAYLDGKIKAVFTDDYFNITLPGELESSSATSPSWYGFVASQIVLNTNLLFSNQPIAKFFLPGVSGTKNMIDRHHIFPEAYLARFNIAGERAINQIANFVYIDYPNNIDISDNPPEEYIPAYREKYGVEEFNKLCSQHALPDAFETMDYNEFLNQRRKLMAGIVRSAYKKLDDIDS